MVLFFLSFLCRLSPDCIPTQCLPDFYLTYKYCLFSIPVYSRTLSCIPLATFTDNTVALNNTLSEWAADAVFNCESDWLWSQLNGLQWGLCWQWGRGLQTTRQNIHDFYSAWLRAVMSGHVGQHCSLIISSSLNLYLYPLSLSRRSGTDSMAIVCEFLNSILYLSQPDPKYIEVNQKLYRVYCVFICHIWFI